MIRLSPVDPLPPRQPQPGDIDLKGEAYERRNVRNAKWTVLHDGFLLPVTNLFDTDGNEIQNPMRAARVIVFNEHVTAGNWFVINIDPGELWSRHAEIPTAQTRD